MLKNRTFAEVIVAVTLFFSVIVPAVLWAVFCIREKKLVPFADGWTPFMAAAQGISVALLGLQQFAARNKTSATAPAS